jgi:hypothetical protein
MLLDDLDPTRTDLLILPGAKTWDVGGGAAFAAAAARFLEAGVPGGRHLRGDGGLGARRFARRA